MTTFREWFVASTAVGIVYIISWIIITSLELGLLRTFLAHVFNG